MSPLIILQEGRDSHIRNIKSGIIFQPQTAEALSQRKASVHLQTMTNAYSLPENAESCIKSIYKCSKRPWGGSSKLSLIFTHLPLLC